MYIPASALKLPSFRFDFLREILALTHAIPSVVDTLIDNSLERSPRTFITSGTFRKTPTENIRSTLDHNGCLFASTPEGTATIISVASCRRCCGRVVKRMAGPSVLYGQESCNERSQMEQLLWPIPSLSRARVNVSPLEISLVCEVTLRLSSLQLAETHLGACKVDADIAISTHSILSSFIPRRLMFARMFEDVKRIANV